MKACFELSRGLGVGEALLALVQRKKLTASGRSRREASSLKLV